MRKQNRKPSDLICLVCGAPAIGFNFAVITCMCCKAFFRRNALFGLQAYQCRYSTENCSIDIRTRRDCSYCRLKKCFSVGMKKELILTEEIKQLKRERILANRNLTHLNSNFNQPTDIFIDLRNIFNAYEEYCRAPIQTYEKRGYELTVHQPIKSRIKFQNYLHACQFYSVSLENFFKHIPEFQQFPSNEQSLLLTHNIRFLIRMNTIETMNNSAPLWAPINFLLEIMYGKSLMETIDVCLHQFKICLNEPQCTQLLLIILLFSTSITYNGNLNTVNLYKIQEKYTDILWIYLVRRYGSLLACQKFSSMIRQCLHLQNIGHKLELKRQNTQWQSFMIETINEFK